MPRRFRTPDVAAPQPAGLPTAQAVALYYRQSTEGQIGNISTTIQTVDMYESLLSMGWQREQVHLIDVDGGVSGRLRIDERAGMKELFGLIVDRKVGAVAAQDEDRFFRDETMIQVDIFIDACKQSRVVVITPRFTYEFHNPLYGAFHARQFRFKCEMGAEYINTQILGKLAGAREHLVRTGRWAGANLAIGYMVDTRRELSPGVPNPNHRQISPFEPHASVVREYFRIFLECGGNIAKTRHLIYQRGVSFPDPASTPPPPGHKYSFQLRPRNGGWYPSRPGMCRMLSNPVYIGHWLHDGVVVRWNNHEALVSGEVFWRAFNYLSSIRLDGSPNAEFRPVRQNARPQVESRRDAERPLAVGLLYGVVHDELVPMRAAWVEVERRYHYHLAPYNQAKSTTNNLLRRRADAIDEAITFHLLEQLKATFSDDGWADVVRRYQETGDSAAERAQAQQLASVERQMQTLLSGMEFYDDPDWIQHSQQRYKELKAERDRLHASAETHATQRLTLDHLEQMRQYFAGGVLAASWENLTRDQRHVLAQQFIERIVLTDFAPRSHMVFVIQWIDQGTPDCPFLIVPTANRGNPFSYADTIRIRQMLTEGASNADVYRAFRDHPKTTVFALCRRVRVLLNVVSEASPRIDFRSRIYPFSPRFLIDLFQRIA